MIRHKYKIIEFHVEVYLEYQSLKSSHRGQHRGGKTHFMNSEWVGTSLTASIETEENTLPTLEAVNTSWKSEWGQCSLGYQSKRKICGEGDEVSCIVCYARITRKSIMTQHTMCCSSKFKKCFQSNAALDAITLMINIRDISSWYSILIILYDVLIKYCKLTHV